MSPLDEPNLPSQWTSERMARGLFLRAVPGHVEFRALPPEATMATHELTIARLGFMYGALRDFRERVGAPELP